MGHLFDSIAKENRVVGYRAEVEDASFSFEFVRTKALKPDQITGLGLSIPSDPGTVWPCELCNTKIDAHGERFPLPILQRFADQMNQKELTFNLFHDPRRGVGHTLTKAEVVPSPDGTYHTLKGYVWIDDAAKLPDQDITINQAITRGTYKEVSVEVRGRVQYVEEGARGIFEYYVDPERPEYPRIDALALVQNGAQPGAALATKVKSLTAQNENSNLKNMQHYVDACVVAGEGMVFKTIESGGSVQVEGLEKLKAKAETLFKEATEAKTKAAEADAAKVAAESELKALRTPLETEAKNLTLALKKTAKTDAEYAAMKAADLVSHVAELRKEFEGDDTKSKSADSTFNNVNY